MGTIEPHHLHESIWDAIIEMAGGDRGWSVFGMSILDGHHSVTLTLDNNDPQNPKIFWSDQWSSRRGWQEFNRTGLDNEVSRLTRDWWNRFPTRGGGRRTTTTRLWRIRQPLRPYRYQVPGIPYHIPP
jgi:hypothetical protein